MDEKSIAEIETQLQSGSEELTEEELERYLAFARIQEEIDRENINTLFTWQH